MSLVYTAGGMRLYIGGKSDAKNRDKLEQRGITHILNVTPTKDSGIQVSYTIAIFAPHTQCFVILTSSLFFWSNTAWFEDCFRCHFDYNLQILFFPSNDRVESQIILKRAANSPTNGYLCMIHRPQISWNMPTVLLTLFPRACVMAVYWFTAIMVFLDHPPVLFSFSWGKWMNAL